MSEAIEKGKEAIQGIVDQSFPLAVGENEGQKPVDSGANFLSWIVRTSELIPAWWSTARDRKLGAMWKESNHLSVAVYNTQAKIVGINPTIVARDPSIAAHADQAERLTHELFASADFGRGWEVAYAKFVESLLTQDNGAFMEIIGHGDPAGPIVGVPVSIRHLDSSRCSRTGHPIYPVTYMDDTGKMYKLHFTRVIYMTQMPSPFRDMNGMGFCAVSRSIDLAQTLVDMIRYKQERLGSRPHNQILVGKGITANQIMLSLRQAEEELSNRGLTRYARTVAIGSESTDIDLTKIDLNHLDPFDEETSTNLAMFAIAAAFGMDADEIWPVGGKSAGKAEANIRRMRSRGRLPAQVTAETKNQFEFKVLPQHLMMEFDYKDDEEDMQRANIRDIRARNRERDLGTGAINVRGARMRMLDSGDLDRQGFDRVELSDGRLPDGTTIGILFYSQDPDYKRLLGGFMDNPLRIAENLGRLEEAKTPIDPENAIQDNIAASNAKDLKFEQVIAGIQAQREVVLEEWATTPSKRKTDKLRHAFFALDWLEEQYNFAAGRALPPVPMQARRVRTDIRVAPEEMSPDQGEASPAANAMVQDENVESIGQA